MGSPGSPALGPSTCPAATWSPCGSSSPATGSTPTGARSTSPATTWGPTRRLASARCGSIREKGYVTEHAGDASYGQTGGVPIDALPLTDLDLAHESRITEDENLRFSMPVSVLGRLRKRNRGGKGVQDRRPGGQPPAGPGNRTGQPRRGRPGQERGTRPLDLFGLRCRQDALCRARRDRPVPQDPQGAVRQGRRPGWRLTVQADVDMLQFHAVANEAEGINIGEALRTAATRLLDMGPDDLQLLLVQKPDDKLDLLIYDPMPGGSGLLEQMLARWQELIATAKDVAGRVASRAARRPATPASRRSATSSTTSF